MFDEEARVEGRISFVQAGDERICFGLELIGKDLFCSLKQGLPLPRVGQLVRVVGRYATEVQQAMMVNRVEVLAEPA